MSSRSFKMAIARLAELSVSRIAFVEMTNSVCRIWKIWFGLLICLLSACQSAPSLSPQLQQISTIYEVAAISKNLKNSWQQFEIDGPITYTPHIDFKIRLSREQVINSDLFLTHAFGKSPLVVFLHGNKSYKETHRNQAIRAATWGMHALVLELPNEHEWLKNGLIVSQLVKLIYVWPSLVGEKLDINRIAVVGHSFGGSAASVAAGSGAPIQGLVLLDPALYSKSVDRYIEKIDVPTLIVGADRKIFRSRFRENFFKLIRRNVSEMSLMGAGHYDAEYPSRNQLRSFGVDFTVSQKQQERFTAALISGLVSLNATGGYQLAWTTLRGQDFRWERRKLSSPSRETRLGRIPKGLKP